MLADSRRGLQFEFDPTATASDGHGSAGREANYCALFVLFTPDAHRKWRCGSGWPPLGHGLDAQPVLPPSIAAPSRRGFIESYFVVCPIRRRDDEALHYERPSERDVWWGKV
jgi:hypothetical protein